MLFRHNWHASANQKLGLDPVSWALIGSAALGAGGTAYSANQQKKGQERATAAAEKQAKLSQGQEGANVAASNYKRKRPGAAGFDAANAMLMPAGGGAGLLGS